jgi:FixJ family two-component response regulator
MTCFPAGELVMPNRKPLIGLVEDDPSVRKALARLLRVEQFEVRIFGSAEEFLSGTEKDRFACLILDVKLPGLSGFDLYCSGVHTPTIFITADERNWERAASLNISHEMFLCKPFPDSALLGAVKAALSGASGTSAGSQGAGNPCN